MTNAAERARRFDLHLAVRYRPVGEAGWAEGQIENISSTGILFWTDRLLAMDTPLEMAFGLAVGDAASEVLCRGRIVRTVLPPARRSAPGLAVTISRYRFLRTRPART